MQSLTSAEIQHVEFVLKQDRQWRREERIKHAKRKLKLAYKETPSEVPVRKAILRRLDYDYFDKVNARAIAEMAKERIESVK